MVLDVRNILPGQTKALLGKTRKTDKKSSSGTNKVAVDSDSVELTGQASQIASLVAQMKAAPVLDPDRVSPVAEKLSQGKYKIEYEQVANKMLDFESSYYGY